MTRADYPDVRHKASVQYFALILGLGFLVAGILGFVPGVTVMHGVHHELAVEKGYGTLLGIFPVNVLHNLVHVLFGLWGIAAFGSFAASRLYARSVAIIYAVLAVMGLVPALWSAFGLVPLWGSDVLLHGGIAVVAAVFGFAPMHERGMDFGHGHRPHHV